MTKGLVRYQQCGCFHFVTFSCYRRLPYFGTESARSLFERSLEVMRLVMILLYGGWHTHRS
jgi:putative transposase